MNDDFSKMQREGLAWTRHALERERSQTRLLIILTTTLLPAWIPFDFVLEPAAAPRILLLRLTDTAVGLACFVALRRSRGLNQVRTIAAIKVVSTGVAIALMLPMVERYFWPYVLGFSLLFWGSAVVLAMPVSLMAGSWGLVLTVAIVGVATGPFERTYEELLGAGFYIVSMFVVCVTQVALRVRLEHRAFLFAHRLEEANRRILESEALKSQFFANVSHELRTPLALILGPTEKLLAEPQITDEQRDRLKHIARNASLLLGRVNDLLDVTRLELGQLKIHHARTDLAQLVRTVAHDFEGTARSRAIHLVVEAPEALPCEADPDKVQAILLNLLSNAFKVTPRGGQIRCTLVEDADATSARDETRAALEVADSGPGIAPEHRGLVFERFRQIEEGPTRTLGGTGLGLAITKDLVELHGGTIELGDAREGGASFRIVIPLRAPPDARVVQADWEETPSSVDLTRQALAALEIEELPADEAEGEAPLVLVVEDNPELNRFVRESLAPGYRTASALDGLRGLEKALTLTPDLIVTDVMMPEMSGEQLVHAVRARRELEHVPILVLSARADDPLRVRLLREGAQDYVTKPFSADELRARVENLVGMARARLLLQADLETKEQSVERLAREATQKRRELSTAVESARVARDVAERASDVKTRFLRVVSHELRSPLTTLLLSLERLRSTIGPSSERALPVLSRMERAAKRLLGLVESLLEYARIESGKLVLELERFDLVQLARDAIEELLPQAEAKGLSLQLVVPEGEPPPLASDPRLVKLIAVNLIGNAIKFTSEGGVFVTVEWQPGAHRLAVQDTGPGIEPEQRAQIFEPFEQAEPTREKHAAGAGLGLALVREMVQALGGDIELLSEPGHGSTFAVQLPPVTTDKPRLEDHPYDQNGAAG